MNKKPNILLFHVGTWFSLKFWRALCSRFCPPFSFFREGNWIISRLAGSSPEVSAFLVTRTGIGLKNPAQSNCGFEVTHITDGAVNIAPTSLGAFLSNSAVLPAPLPVMKKKKNVICRKVFIKRCQPSIDPAITHAITLIILPCHICVMWYDSRAPPTWWDVPCSSVFFSPSELMSAGFNRLAAVRFLKLSDFCKWISLQLHFTTASPVLKVYVFTCVINLFLLGAWARSRFLPVKKDSCFVIVDYWAVRVWTWDKFDWNGNNKVKLNWKRSNYQTLCNKVNFRYTPVFQCLKS